MYRSHAYEFFKPIVAEIQQFSIFQLVTMPVPYLSPKQLFTIFSPRFGLYCQKKTLYVAGRRKKKCVSRASNSRQRIYSGKKNSKGMATDVGRMPPCVCLFSFETVFLPTARQRSRVIFFCKPRGEKFHIDDFEFLVPNIIQNFFKRGWGRTTRE